MCLSVCASVSIYVCLSVRVMLIAPHCCIYLLLYFCSLVSPGMASHSLSPDEVTRVVYYLDKDETPYRTSIPKRSVLNTRCDCTIREFAKKSLIWSLNVTGVVKSP